MQIIPSALLVLPLLAALAAPLRADELHLTSGEVLHGRLEEQTRGGYKFLEVGARRAKTIKTKTVEKLVLTYKLPDFVYEDPQWSQQMIDDRLASDFDPEWGEMEILRSEHYIVITNSSAGKKYLDTMEDTYKRFRKIFPFEEDKDARLMPVFLFKTRQHYIGFTVKNTGLSESQAAGTGGHAWKDYYATYYDAPRDPVHYHEGAHQLVHNRLEIRGGGSWFQEGMAVYFEGTVFSAEDPAKGMKSEIRSDRHTPLAELMELRSLLMSSDSNSDASLGSRRYRQAGSIIKFLVEGRPGKHYQDMLDGLKAGKKWPEIFQETCGLSVEEIEEQWKDFYGA
jgi:hypothetical protein